VLNSSESLPSLLTVQQALSSAISGTDTLSEVLPGIFRTILETMESQNGRLLLIARESNQAFVLSAVDGRIEIEALNFIPELLTEEVERFETQHGREVVVTNSQLDGDVLAGPQARMNNTLWSEISVALHKENSIVGILSAMRRGSDQFTLQHNTLLSLFAGQITAALTAVKFKKDWRAAEARVQEISHDNHNLAAILVHDLQGPLGNVLTSLELLQAGVEGNDGSSLPLMMDIAIKSSKLLEALVNSLLDISRLEAGQPVTDLEHVAISEIIDFVAEVEGLVLEERYVTLVRELDPDLPLIKVNIDIFQRVLLNLFDNAIKVSKRGQRITVSAHFDSQNEAVRIGVVDQGPGIPEAYHERIFEKYQRLNYSSTSKGLGLGLAFCKLAIEAHGGHIWVENTPDQGACFCIMIPVDFQAKSNI
jgi:signal transduction histidine kinase